jgi:hypothetical protein
MKSKNTIGNNPQTNSLYDNKIIPEKNRLAKTISNPFFLKCCIQSPPLKKCYYIYYPVNLIMSYPLKGIFSINILTYITYSLCKYLRPLITVIVSKMTIVFVLLLVFMSLEPG